MIKNFTWAILLAFLHTSSLNAETISCFDNNAVLIMTVNTNPIFFSFALIRGGSTVISDLRDARDNIVSVSMQHVEEDKNRYYDVAVQTEAKKWVKSSLKSIEKRSKFSIRNFLPVHSENVRKTLFLRLNVDEDYSLDQITVVGFPLSEKDLISRGAACKIIR